MRAFTELLQPTFHISQAELRTISQCLNLDILNVEFTFHRTTQGNIRKFPENVETFSQQDIVIKVSVPDTLLKYSQFVKNSFLLPSPLRSGRVKMYGISIFLF